MVDWQSELGKTFGKAQAKAGKVFRKAGGPFGEFHEHPQPGISVAAAAGRSAKPSAAASSTTSSSILWDGPRHGYDIMLTIEEKRGFRPSPGSIYPALQMLEEGDFLTGQDIDGKRVYTITEKGSECSPNIARRRPPTARRPTSEAHVALITRAMQTMMGVKTVLKEIARTRNLEMYAQALAIHRDARAAISTKLLTHE